MARLTQDEFLQRARAEHGDTYNYSRTVYVNNSTKILIICREHGPFRQAAYSHINGCGCPACGRHKTASTHRITQEQFLQRARMVHGNTYDYSAVKYSDYNYTKVIIVCPQHGAFLQLPNNHNSGDGCPTCDRSRGEKEVASALSALGFNFVPQAKLIPGRNHRFDFHLPRLNTLIEYNGEQHYVVVPWWGGKRHLNRVCRNDRYKARWARRNGYRLITIPYTVVDIEGYLRKRLAA